MKNQFSGTSALSVLRVILVDSFSDFCIIRISIIFLKVDRRIMGLKWPGGPGFPLVSVVVLGCRG